ncbi:hypothetical protein CROQUDRAFT_90718 [Cronartium quercuum f. sp. fusiforme G11]|uniref:Uncharacterized protein n=1 Tax=Cronartium quercuum f. sp. fusiforme G11 TaxID=708437 RepID=A0A9P6NPZ2_9BASI|nr:hypothetical protein CROQUDRAFT_90718 [Cronartium quercuum f. sp. fusiforme G11]
MVSFTKNSLLSISLVFISFSIINASPLIEEGSPLVKRSTRENAINQHQDFSRGQTFKKRSMMIKGAEAKFARAPAYKTKRSVGAPPSSGGSVSVNVKKRAVGTIPESGNVVVEATRQTQHSAVFAKRSVGGVELSNSLMKEKSPLQSIKRRGFQNPEKYTPARKYGSSKAWKRT